MYLFEEVQRSYQLKCNVQNNIDRGCNLNNEFDNGNTSSVNTKNDEQLFEVKCSKQKKMRTRFLTSIQIIPMLYFRSSNNT